MKWMWIVQIALVALTVAVSAQDYGEFARGAGMARRRNNKAPLMIAAVSGLFGGLIGGILQNHRCNKKFAKDKKELLEYIKLQDEVSRQREKGWQTEYQKIYKAYEELEKETVERDYEEFKAPDTNNDDMISREEFNTYVTKYLSSFPELSEKDFPKFEDFDLDHDGMVSFDEWQRFLVQQKAMEAKKAKSDKAVSSGKESGSGGGAYQELLEALYDSSNGADSFNSLNKNLSKGRQKRKPAEDERKRPGSRN